MDENIDYNELFGIDPEPDTGDEAGVNEQEVTAPDDAEAVEGANEQAVAEPDDRASEPRQSPEENARYAAARRQAEAERDEAVRKAREDADREIADIFRAAGMVNPYTGDPIRSRDDFNAYKSRYDSEQLNKVKKAAGLDDEGFERMVEGLPQVQAAREAEARAQEIVRANQEREAQLAADAGIKNIQKYDPNIKSIADLAAMPEYPQFYDYVVKRGLSYEDAYVLTHRSTITDKSAAAARQAAYNAQSKSHLVGASSRGRTAAEIPHDVLEQYRLFNPDASMDEIRAHWAKSRK